MLSGGLQGVLELPQVLEGLLPQTLLLISLAPQHHVHLWFKASLSGGQSGPTLVANSGLLPAVGTTGTGWELLGSVKKAAQFPTREFAHGVMTTCGP